ncbi:MAG: serine/threonine-protein kinase, partial [Polyangiaceae bacterium]
MTALPETRDACVDDDTLAALVDGRIDPQSRALALAHLARCDSCSSTFALLLSSQVDPENPASSSFGQNKPRGVRTLPSTGQLIGRYRLGKLLGAGAMGMVFLANDPELSRDVALKLLRFDELGKRSHFEARLVREARTLARLNHPNVVTVYDVGTFDGGVFIAMEYVSGGTLATWLTTSPRSLEQTLDVFKQIADGVIAAHQVGIVHRDLKPDNVLIGVDGRIRVSDFGLARKLWNQTELATDSDDAGDGPEPMLAHTGRQDAVLSFEKTPGVSGVESVLTRTGALVGTPAYMSPEQLTGGATAASDQYSYCLMMLEALCGERPTRDKIGDYLGRSPSWIRPILTRGLREQPEERWPTMLAMLGAIELRRKRRRQRPWVALFASLFVAVPALVWFTQKYPLSCDASGASLANVWNGSSKTNVLQAFQRTFPGEDSERFGIIDRALDSYRDSLIRGAREACEATRIHGVQSEALLDRRMGCLEDRRRAVEHLTTIFSSGGEATLSRAPDAVE